MRISRDLLTEDDHADRYKLEMLIGEMDDDPRWNDWERQFVEDVATRIGGNKFYTLTDAQRDVLEKIWEKW